MLKLKDTRNLFKKECTAEFELVKQNQFTKASEDSEKKRPLQAKKFLDFQIKHITILQFARW